MKNARSDLGLYMQLPFRFVLIDVVGRRSRSHSRRLAVTRPRYVHCSALILFCSQHLDENAFTVHSIASNYAHSFWILFEIRGNHVLWDSKTDHPLFDWWICQDVRVVLILSLLRARALSSLVAQSLSYFLVF